MAAVRAGPRQGVSAGRSLQTDSCGAPWGLPFAPSPSGGLLFLTAALEFAEGPFLVLISGLGGFREANLIR